MAINSKQAVLGVGIVAIALGGAIALMFKPRSRGFGLRGVKEGTEEWDARERRDEAFQKIWNLMHDPDPHALDVAEDLALENGIKLREFGRGGYHSTSSNMHGSFVLSPWGAANAPTTRVSWQVVPFSQGDGDVGYQTEMTVMADDEIIVPAHVVREIEPPPRESKRPEAQRRRERSREARREQAQQYAVHDAWRVAKYVKRAQARGTPLAEIATGITNDTPVPVPRERLKLELYGSVTRTKR